MIVLKTDHYVTFSDINMVKMENDIVIPSIFIFYQRFVDDIHSKRQRGDNVLFNRLNNIIKHLLCTASKVSKYGAFSGPYFPVFGLNAEIYFVNLRIQSDCGKITTRRNSVFGHFSHSDSITT